ALRWHEYGCLTNTEVPGHLLRREFRLPRTTIRLIEDALRRGRVTSRGADRALRVAWTVCDLRGGDLPDADDVTTALVFKERALR
ncbi:MAG TPA: ATP-binding protein, partial [Aldersonia sp.]